MISKNNARQADACRFCWMCRHICPVSNCCGSESWTPRAKGLLISMVERGEAFTREIADTMYHCTLCDACANDCATGYKPSEFIREARTVAVVEALAPQKIQDMIHTILDTGSIFGRMAASEIIFDAAGELPETADTLLYLGQTARAVCPETGAAAVRLLKKAGVAFTLFRDEPCSGAYLGELMGYTGEVQKLAVAVDQAVRAAGAKTLLVLNPADAVIFHSEYQKWGLLSGIRIATFTSYLSELIDQKRLVVRQQANMNASLHEPVKLTREFDEEQLLKNLCTTAGITLVELFLHGKMSRCVGTVPFEMYDSQVVKKMVAVRVEDASRLGCSTMITGSPDDQYIMKKYADASMKIVNIVSLLDELS